MSIKIIESILNDFIKSDTPQVIAINWDWGSWKTYFWNNFLKKQDFSTEKNYKTYSYCSLFWENDILSIKNKIFYNKISLPNKISWLKRFFKKTEDLTEIADIKSFKNISKITIDILFLRIKKCLICFDDFEKMEKYFQ